MCQLKSPHIKSQHVFEILEEHKAYTLPIDILNKMIQALTKEKDFRNAYDIFKNISLNKRTYVTYNTIINTVH